MNRKLTTLTAISLAMVASNAHAEDGLEFYGIISTGIEAQSVKAGPGQETQERLRFDTGEWSGSRLGVKGNYRVTETMVANFTLEGGYDSTDGDQSQGGRIFGRKVTAGLVVDGVGTFELGRVQSVGTDTLSQHDPFGASFGTSSFTSSFGSSFTRWDDSIRFVSEDISGFTMRAMYSFDPGLSTNSDRGRFETDEKDRALSLGVDYKVGPTTVSVAHDRYFSNDNNTGSGSIDNDTNVKTYALGATHDFGTFKLHALVGREEDGIVGAADALENLTSGTVGGALTFADGASKDVAMLGASMPWASGILRVGVQTADLDAGVEDTSNVLDRQIIGSVAYTQELTERFGWYAYASYADNLNMVKGAKSSMIGSGVRISF